MTPVIAAVSLLAVAACDYLEERQAERLLNAVAVALVVLAGCVAS